MVDLSFTAVSLKVSIYFEHLPFHVTKFACLIVKATL